MIDTDRLRKVFRASLGLPDDVDVDALEYQAIDKWDSLAHMTLVAALEDEFGVMLDTDDVLAVSSFPAARDVLEKLGAA
ncbi:MAG TPA: acyl carrier protein [Streptosporangiaceae bacterium]